MFGGRHFEVGPAPGKLFVQRGGIFGEAAGEIGFTKPLGNYSEAEALQVIDAIVTCYTEAMVEHHEASKYPPVRGMPPTPDPMTPSSANPFADLEDDLPWEEPKGKKP